MDGKAQMGEPRGEEGHAIAKVKDSDFGYNGFDQVDVIDVVAGFLRNQDVGFGDFQGVGQGILGTGGVRNGLGWVEIVQD